MSVENSITPDSGTIDDKLEWLYGHLQASNPMPERQDTMIFIEALLDVRKRITEIENRLPNADKVAKE